MISRGVVLLLVAGGCVPFVVPPARVRMGVGQVRVDAADQAPQGANTLSEISVGVHPLQLDSANPPEALDVGLGYRVEGVQAGEGREHAFTAHGPELEVGYYPFRFRAARLGFFTEFAALDLTGDRGRWEPGVAVGTVLELTGFSNGSASQHDADGVFFGKQYGQWGVGIYAGAAYRGFDDRQHLQATLGLAVRIPFLAGIAVPSPRATVQLLEVTAAAAGAAADARSSEDESTDSREPSSERTSPRTPRRDYTPARPRRQE
ncbi:MAG TPA: hypothetical protein VIM73_19725 [Polyangiaceae bacterium]